jgi:hypothetical protein
MAKLGSSEHQFDKWFGAKVSEVHGIDLAQPPPGPPPQLYLDSGS